MILQKCLEILETLQQTLLHQTQSEICWKSAKYGNWKLYHQPPENQHNLAHWSSSEIICQKLNILLNLILAAIQKFCRFPPIQTSLIINQWVLSQNKSSQSSEINVLRIIKLITIDLTTPMISPGYQTSDSASSSKFHHLALVALLLALVSCSSKCHHLPLLALLVALVLH